MCRTALVLAIGAGFLSPAPSIAVAETHKCFGKVATIVGTSDRDRIDGTNADDVIVALGGTDFVNAKSGRDRVCMGRGGNIEEEQVGNGGRGDDHISGGRGRDYLTGFEGDDVIRGGPHRDTFYGREGADVISGGAERDYLNGEEGRDILRGDEGSDLLEGARGNDTLIGGANGISGDIIRHYEGAEDSKSVTVNLTKGLSVGRGRDQLRGIENARGNDGDDLLIGDVRDNILEGVSGDDVLRSAGGADCINPGPGSNRVYGGKGTDLHTFYISLSWRGALACFLSDYPGSVEPPLGDNGGVTIDLPSGTADTLKEHSRLFSIEGAVASSETDTLIGDDADNYFFGDGSNDDIEGRGGDDVLIGAGSNDDLKGGPGNDSLNGQAGIDTADGGDDNDECLNAEVVLNCES